MALPVAFLGLAGSMAHADVTSSQWDMNEGIICDYLIYLWQNSLDISGSQSGAAELQGSIYTDSPADPTLTLDAGPGTERLRGRGVWRFPARNGNLGRTSAPTDFGSNSMESSPLPRRAPTPPRRVS